MKVIVDMITALLLQAVASGSKVHIWSRLQGPWNSVVHPSTDGPSRLKKQGVPHANKNSTPITTLLFFFMEVIMLLAGTNLLLSIFQNM
jgi:hypothetical protein